MLDSLTGSDGPAEPAAAMHVPHPEAADRPRSSMRGWGGAAADGIERSDEDLAAITVGAALSRGLGRSYGDSSLPARPDDAVANSVRADRILAFDGQTGALRAEAGLSLFDLNRLLLPRGWFTPVSPGTQFVTLGGMVASDVHGKNHHRDGCFGEHVRSLLLRVPSGDLVTCSPEVEPELFWATVGGMGLTGHILEVEFTMRAIPSPWIWMESERIDDIDAYVAGLKAAGPDWPFTMGWIDCLSRGRRMGRGILMRGRWAEPHEAPRRFAPMGRSVGMPFTLPGWVIGPASVRAFNFCYYWAHLKRRKQRIVHPQKFFYPLDAINDWNRLYGPNGFTQYQCVLPESAGPHAARRFLDVLTGRGGASFLCVIKDCGPEGRGLLSFPMPGISIAVDLPVRRDTPELVAALNRHVIDEGGRIYLTKDSFTTPEEFAAMEPRLEAWQRVRRHWDPHGRLRSAQSVRLLGDR